MLFFGPEFIGRVEDIVPSIGRERLLFFVGETCPSFAEDYHRATANCSSAAPKVLVDDEDDGAIYYSSGTTGFPKAILLSHRCLLQAARMEPSTTRPPMRTCSCASRLSTTPAPRCTGLVPCLPAARESC